MSQLEQLGDKRRRDCWQVKKGRKAGKTVPQICNNIVPTHVLCLPRCGLMKYHQMYGIIICQVFRKSPMQDRAYTILYSEGWHSFELKIGEIQDPP